MINYAINLFGYIFGRPTLTVRVSRDQHEVVGGLCFEIENIGSRPTSLRPTVSVTFIVPEGPKMVKRTVVYDVRELDRTLPPFTPKMFEATARDVHRNYAFSWFRSYLFTTTTGHWTRAQIRSAQLEPMGLISYWYERIRFRWTGKLNAGAKSVTIAQLDVEARSRGPH